MAYPGKEWSGIGDQEKKILQRGREWVIGGL